MLPFGIAAAALAAPVVRAEIVDEGPHRRRLASEPADVVIVYTADQRGEIGTCGCASRPRGGIARIAGHRLAVAETSPTLLVNAGGVLDVAGFTTGELEPEARARNAAMRIALESARFDAWNLADRDVPGALDGGIAPFAVSANLEGPVVPARGRTLEIGGITVLITGVAAPEGAPSLPTGYSWADPVGAVRAVLATKPADLVIVLTHHLSERAAEIAAIPGVDVVIDANAHPASHDPEVVGPAVRVRARDQGLRLGELRLVLAEGSVISAVDRQVDTDDALPEEPAVRRALRATPDPDSFRWAPR